MRSHDEVLREFAVKAQTYCGCDECLLTASETTMNAMADRLRELEAQRAASEPVACRCGKCSDLGLVDVDLSGKAHPSAAAVTVTDEMVNAAARRGRDYGFNAYCDNAQEYWAAMESVLTAALTAASEGAGA